MSTALVVNTNVAGPAARIANARGAVASSFQTVDSIDTDSLATRGRDQARARDESDLFESSRSRRHATGHELNSTFGGVMVSTEVGTAIVQAQAALAGQPQVTAPAEAERHISLYEFNQSLMGTPQVSTDVGVIH